MQMRPATAPFRSGQSVALFLPCYCDVLFPQVGQACVALFARLGIPLHYPTAQTCCGQPAFNAGYWPEAQTLAERFATVFADFDWVVVPSGSCGAMARIFYPYMQPDSPAARIGARVYDLASFLVDVVGVVEVGARFAHVVTYLDGCHGRRELGATNAALRLLQAVDGLQYAPLHGVEECCGFGGAFSVKYEELSCAMGADKCKQVVASGAGVLTSGDASCLMHINGLAQADRARPFADIRVMHLAEILASPAGSP